MYLLDFLLFTQSIPKGQRSFQSFPLLDPHPQNLSVINKMTIFSTTNQPITR